MHTKMLLPNSVRKFIRREKARIHGTVLNYKEQEELISQLYKRFEKKIKTAKIAQPVAAK